MCFTGKNIDNVYQTFKAMIWFGLLIIWTRYLVASPFPVLRSSQNRPSMISILPVPLSGSACVNSEVYAAPARHSQRRTQSHLPSYPLIPSHSLRGVMVMCTGGPSMAKGFASNVCECMLRATHKSPLKCVLTLSPFLFNINSSPMELTGLLPRGCNVESPEPPKYRATARRHYQSPPAYLELDVWWAPAGIPQGESQRESTWTCRCPSCCGYLELSPVPSYPTSLRASATFIPAM